MIDKPTSSIVNQRGLLSKSEFGKFSAMHGEAEPGEQVSEIYEVAKQQCAAAGKWPDIHKINAWMISSETATFMKVGGLGVVATELPEAFNSTFQNQGDKITVVTPLYLGDTKHKKAFLRKNLYTGAENRSIEIKKITDINVPFVGKNNVLQSFDVGESYYAGAIPFYVRLWYALSTHSLLLVGLALLCTIIAASGIFYFLSRLTQRKLGGR